MDTLKGKVAVVTGGSRDIGRAVSIKLAQEGAKVCINYCHSETKARETLHLVKEAGGEAILVKADVTKAADVRYLMEENLLYPEERDLFQSVREHIIILRCHRRRLADGFEQLIVYELQSVLQFDIRRPEDADLGPETERFPGLSVKETDRDRSFPVKIDALCVFSGSCLKRPREQQRQKDPN